jgi:hypothetical protein
LFASGGRRLNGVRTHATCVELSASDFALKAGPTFCATSRAIAARYGALFVLTLALAFKAATTPFAAAEIVSDMAVYRPFAEYLMGLGPPLGETGLVEPAPGYPFYLALMGRFVSLDDYHALVVPWSLLAALLPVAMYGLFASAGVGLLPAFAASFGYYMAIKTLRHDAVVSTETPACVLLALLLILVVAARSARGSWARSLAWGTAAGAVAVALTFIRPQYQLVLVVLLLATILSDAVPWLLRRVAGIGPAGAPGPPRIMRYAPLLVALLINQAAIEAWSLRNERVHGWRAFAAMAGFVNHAIAVAEAAQPRNEVQAAIQAEMIRRRALFGVPNSMNRAHTEIAARFGLRLGEYGRELHAVCNDALRRSPGPYIRAVIRNLALYFGSTGDPLYGVGYPVFVTRDAWPWRPFGRAAQWISDTRRMPELTVLTAVLVCSTLIGFANNRRALFAILTAAGVVAYGALTAAAAENTDMARYRATVEWLWMGLFLWAATAIAQAAVQRIREVSRPATSRMGDAKVREPFS